MANDERRGLRGSPLTQRAPDSALSWLAEASDDHGVLGLRIGVRGEERIAEWPNIATLTTARDGSAPRWSVSPDASPRALERVQHEVGRALIHHARGGFALHASCVAWDERAIAFVGESGAGKSTLAAYLTEHGAELCADDATCIEVGGDGYRVLPGASPTHALDDAARTLVATARHAGLIDARGVETAKTIAAPRARSTGTPMLAAICVLRWSEDEAPRLDALHGVSSVADIVRHVLRFALDDASRLADELDTLETIARAGLVVELVRARAFEQLPACANLVQARVATCRILHRTSRGPT